LLTDPRIVAEDYLFFDDDPFAPPPHDLDYIGDINTSKAYIGLFRKYITNPSKQGARRFHESGHVESLVMDVANDEGVFGGDNVEKAQDLHTILSLLLEEYLTIQEKGFNWELFYKLTRFEDNNLKI
jgi:hypothetical protein